MRGFITIAIVIFLVGAQASLTTTFEEETEYERDSIGEESDVGTNDNDEVATEIFADDTPSTFDMLQNVIDINDQPLQDFKDVEGCSNNTCIMCIGFLCFKLVYKSNTGLFEFVVGIATVQITLVGIVPAAPFGCCELSSFYQTCMLAQNIRSNDSYICANVTLVASRAPYNFPNVCMKK
ncbi:hypothetical protein CHS0354_027752 [Potamilus streckersoni]|uniref:Uncharacterized protein n=1 Tax=Potamilus streckersoni TaxID=2493646 RepID=A0AAE0T2W3_9BIVA|nr:hypothetical protein CHS0354_027752 [Potamilus streckersoni]